VNCCKQQPGYLVPGDFERIAAHLHEPQGLAVRHFWASPGAVVQDVTGARFSIGTITPRLENGRCVFLDADDRCRVHPVAPFGCAYFGHEAPSIAMPRSVWGLRRVIESRAYAKLRELLPTATAWKPWRY
jgi:Fe-S-cluster containining protein